MAGSFARTLPLLRAAVARLPAGGLAQQRWFAGKARRVTAVELADAARVPGTGSEGVLALVDVRYGDGRSERYFVPGRLVGDALREPDPADRLWSALADMLSSGASLDGAEGSFVARSSSAEPPAAEPGRQLTADQSNTSVVLGERAVLKCYRRLEVGVSPEPELLEALAAVGARVAPRWRATLVHRLGEAETALAVLYDFIPGEPIGWEPVIEGVRAVLGGEQDGEPWLATAAALGATVAELHRGLAAAFGTSVGDADTGRNAVAAADDQLREALPVLDDASGLAPLAAERLASLRRLDGALLGRVHGDLHVAQFVRSDDGLVVVDFEGEPDRPLAERRRPVSPLRDVACLLLSLDHAAVAAARRCGFGATLERAFAWSAEARARALGAYVAGTENTIDRELLAALEVEKECHELLYAAGVLPEWLYAPRLTLPRLLRSRPA